MKQIRALNSWIKLYDQVVASVGDLQVLFDFYKDGEGIGSRYAMLNALAILNHPGQYVVRGDGTKTKIYLWPVKKEGEPSGVTITRRPFGFNVNGQSHVTIEGFVVRRLVARSEVNLAPICDGESKPNPGVVIREGNQAAWSSLADGVKPKWLEVDTMSSHLVKSVAVALPDPKQIRQVALHGMLADEYAEIAAYPPRAALAGQGLRAEYYNIHKLLNLTK